MPHPKDHAKNHRGHHNKKVQTLRSESYKERETLKKEKEEDKLE